jgi:rhodanese-related sulfurtransferase
MPVRYLIGWVLAGALAMLALSACAPGSAGMELSAPEAHQRTQAGQLTLIDIRRPDEWRQTGVAQGAARIDMRRPDFAEAVLQQVKGQRDAPIGIICRTGNRTTHMQKAMRDAGFTQVYNIKEGMAGSAAGPGWLRQGLPVEACTRC